MNSIGIKSVFNLLLLTVLVVIIIAGQIRLSKQDNKFLGLILPMFSFTLSILVVLNMISYFELTEMVNGTTVSTEKTLIGWDVSSKVTMFALMNIPTFVLSFIYLGERNKFKKKSRRMR